MNWVRQTIVLKGAWGAFLWGVKGAVAVFTSGLLPNRVLVAKHLCGDSATAERVTLCEEFFPLVKVGGPTSTKEVGVPCRGCTKGAGKPNWLPKARKTTNTRNHSNAMVKIVHPNRGRGG